MLQQHKPSLAYKHAPSPLHPSKQTRKSVAPIAAAMPHHQHQGFGTTGETEIKEKTISQNERQEKLRVSV
jgi:hypothetical protein